MQLKDLEEYMAIQKEGVLVRHKALKQRKRMEVGGKRNARVYDQKFEEETPTFATSVISCQVSPWKGKLRCKKCRRREKPRSECE